MMPSRGWILAGLLTALLAALVAGCGGRRRRRDQPRGRRPAVEPSETGGSGGGGVAPGEGRRLRPAALRRPAARQRRPLRGREARAASGSSATARRSSGRRSTSAPRSPTTASRACSRSPSRPTSPARGFSMPTSPTRTRTSTWSSSEAGDDGIDRAGSRARGAADGRLRLQPQRRPAPLRPGRSPLHRHRRRRQRRRPGAKRPGPRLAARQDPPDRPAPRQETSPTRSRRDNPFADRAGRPARGLLLRPAQPLALQLRPRDRALSIGDVGQNSLEEVDYVAGGRGARRQLRLVGIRGNGALQRGPGGARRTCRRSSPTAATRAARSPAATSSATPTLPSLTGPLPLRGLLRGRAAQLRAQRRGGARDDRPLGLEVPQPQLLRRGRQPATSTRPRWTGRCSGWSGSSAPSEASRCSEGRR